MVGDWQSDCIVVQCSLYSISMGRHAVGVPANGFLQFLYFILRCNNVILIDNVPSCPVMPKSADVLRTKRIRMLNQMLFSFHMNVRPKKKNQNWNFNLCVRLVNVDVGAIRIPHLFTGKTTTHNVAPTHSATIPCNAHLHYMCLCFIFNKCMI